MADSEKSNTNTNYGMRLVPFTGPFFAIYAFFWPESFAQWWGAIVGTIIAIVRAKGGF